MTRTIPTLLLISALASGVAFAQPVPPAPPAPPAAPSATRLPKAKKISLQFSGRLGDALKEIAARGGINLVVTGKLDAPAEVYLSDVSAAEALEIVAQTHQLKLSRQGSIWTVRAMSADELAQLHESASELAEAERDAQEARREAEEAAREAQRDAQEAMREAQEEAREAAREAAEAAREAMREAGMQEGRVRERLSRAERRLNRNGRDLSHYGPVIVREGETVRNAVAYGGPLEVYGHVEQDAVSFGGPVKLGPKAVVEGDVVAFGGPIERAEGAVVEGDQIAMAGAVGSGAARSFRFRGGPQVDDQDDDDSRGRSGSPFPAFFGFFVVLFSVGFLSMMVAPNGFKALLGQLKENPVRSGAIGAAAVPGIPLAMLVTIPTVIGPIVIFLVTAVGYLMGIAAIAHEIGQHIPVPYLRKTRALVLAVGLLVLLIAFQIPVLGWFTFAVVSLLSLGMLLRALWSRRRRMGTPQPA